MTVGTFLVMRHAEKPRDPADPDLSDEGRARSVRLADYIPQTFGPPDFLFAASISPHSERPLQTLLPLANKLGLGVNTSFADPDYAALAKSLLQDPDFHDKLVVVSWHHGNIPALARALTAARGDYPDPWSPDVFNLILKFQFHAGAPPATSRVVEPF